MRVQCAQLLKLRQAEVFETELSAFTQNVKYWTDLKTICDGEVICDREEYLADSFLPEYYDYVVVDRPLNRYHEPQKLIDTLFSLCKEGGFVVCSLKNTASFQEYVNLLGERQVYDREFSYNIPLEALKAALDRKGSVKSIFRRNFNMNGEQQSALADLLPQDAAPQQKKELLARMLCESFLIVVQK